MLRKDVDSHKRGETCWCVCVFCPVRGQVLHRTVLSDHGPCQQGPWPNHICLEMLFSQIGYETIFHLAMVMDNVLLGVSQF